ncbi:MAG: ABC transporter substrate-binding protein [Deltaproteobacteria bacterium]|nr:ABC transporter substrate-binding protein [Deltaproteobacteria bacterium]MBI3078542.1 ABC transporter substrate-binding protein [Deltaproteobacteria bacterium]
MGQRMLCWKTLGVGALIIMLSATAALAAQPLKTLIPHRVFFDTALPDYVAEERGLFREAGLVVQPVWARGGGENIQIVLAGNADIAWSTGFHSVIGAVGKGAPLAIVSAEITGLPDVFWYARTDSPIRGLRDLAGKKLTFSRPGASTHMAVLAAADMLKAQGLEPPSLIGIGGPPEAFTTVMTGQVDAGWSVPPFFLKEVEEGKIRIVLRGSELKALEALTIRVNFTTRKLLQERPDDIRKLLRLRKEALDWIHTHKEAAADIWSKRANLKEPRPVLLKAWDFYPREALRMFPPKGVEQNLADALKFKFIARPLTPEQVRQMIAKEFAPE